jgi:hypothetical protein
METAELVERLARERTRILLASLVTYALWCGTFVLQQSGWFAPGTRSVLTGVTVLFALPWVLCTVWLTLWGRRVRAQPQVIAALNDEMTVRNRWRAQRASAFVLLVCLVLGVVATSYVDLSGRMVLLILIWVLVVSQLGFYLWYDRSE